MLIKVFLHAEFKSVMKTVKKSYDFHEKCEKNRKMNNFGNFC